MIYPRIISTIKAGKKVAILSHVMPDGDNIGSCLGLYNALIKAGKVAKVILDDKVPRNLMFLKNADKIEMPQPLDDFDLVVALDCGDMERLGKSGEFIKDHTVVNIDHHISNTEFGTLNMVDSNASATAEIVYQVIKIMGIDMDKDISECLYTGIVTDSGGFQYSNTTSITHQIAGDLLNNGVSAPETYAKIYLNNPKEKLYLIREALNKLEFFENDRISCICLTRADLKRAGFDDTDGVVSLGRDIESVEVSIFLKEVDDKIIKVGLRSKRTVDVSKIAMEFGGGGHVRASGCTINGDMGAATRMIIEAVTKALRDGEVK